MLKLYTDLLVEMLVPLFSLIENLAFVLRNDIFHHFDSRGFSGPVRAQQAKAASCSYFKGNTINCSNAVILFFQIFDFNDAVHLIERLQLDRYTMLEDVPEEVLKLK